MDRAKNPFSPGAGSPPPALAGRSTLLEDAMVALERVKNGRAEKSMILVGLRGKRIERHDHGSPPRFTKIFTLNINWRRLTSIRRKSGKF